MKQPKTGGRTFYPAPRFRRRSGTAKIQAVNGLRVEIFVRKYYPSIDSLDRCKGNEWELQQDFMSSLAIYEAYINNKLVGVIATRNNGNHIALFFVDGAYHRQGIGRKLFEVVLENSTSDNLTVNSSPYAKDVYHRLGFEDTDVEQVVTGIRFIPMVYVK